MDGDKNGEVADFFGVQGFPTLKMLFKNASSIEYDAGPVVGDLFSWVSRAQSDLGLV